MGMIMSQKILAAHVGLEEAKAGQLIEADLNLMLRNGITSPVAINEVKEMNRKTIFDKDKIALIMDHFIPNKDIKSVENCKHCRESACRHEITSYFDVGDMGIEYALPPERRSMVAEDVIVDTDSHTYTHGALEAFSTGVGSTDMAADMVTGKTWLRMPPAIEFQLVGGPAKWVSDKDVILHIAGMISVGGALYKPMEFVGKGVRNFSIGDRSTIYSMAIETGGKNGIFPADELAVEYTRKHSKREFTAYETDEDAEYGETYVIDLSELKPTVSFPHLPSNTRIIDQVGEVKVGQAAIGSCTNDYIEDVRIATGVLRGRRITKGMHCVVISVTQPIHLQAMKEGLLEIFIETGAVVSMPTCGSCLSGYMGILTAGGRCTPTTDRNFVGRMRHVGSEMCLVSPAVAAASAVVGKIICSCQLD